LQHYTSEETCLSTFQSPIDPSTILGGFPGSDFTEVIYYYTWLAEKKFMFWCLTAVAWQASALVITYPVNNKVETTEQENGKAVAWERAFIKLVKVCNANLVSKLRLLADSSAYEKL
jgi:Niemann-Pick C1 protein